MLPARATSMCGSRSAPDSTIRSASAEPLSLRAARRQVVSATAHLARCITSTAAASASPPRGARSESRPQTSSAPMRAPPLAAQDHTSAGMGSRPHSALSAPIRAPHASARSIVAMSWRYSCSTWFRMGPAVDTRVPPKCFAKLSRQRLVRLPALAHPRSRRTRRRRPAQSRPVHPSRPSSPHSGGTAPICSARACNCPTARRVGVDVPPVVERSPPIADRDPQIARAGQLVDAPRRRVEQRRHGRDRKEPIRRPLGLVSRAVEREGGSAECLGGIPDGGAHATRRLNSRSMGTSSTPASAPKTDVGGTEPPRS